MTTYTSDDYNLYRVSGNYYSAAIVASELSADASLSEEARKGWADAFWRVYWKCDEDDRKDLLDRGFAPDRES